MKNFHGPTKLLWDCGAEDAFEEIFGRESWRKTGIIIDKAVRALAVLGPALTKLRRISNSVNLFEQEVAEPDTDYVDSVTAFFQKDPPEAIVGIGGGSTLDVAKAVSVLLTNPGGAAKYQGLMLVEKPGLPTIMVPTTAGTGSEVTWTAVFTNRKQMVKAGINSPYLFARYAVLDARLTVSMPIYLTTCTGMDALAHSIESFTARSANIVSRMVSKQAFELLFRNIASAIRDGNGLEARRQVQLGSTLAGWAIVSAGTGAGHSIAYALGTHFHVPHSVALAMLLPKVMRINQGKIPGLYATLWDLVAPEDNQLPQDEKSERVIARLEELLKEAGFKSRLSDYGVSGGDIELLASKGLALKSALQNNPAKFVLDDSLTVLGEIL